MCQFKDGSAQLIIEGKGGLKKKIIICTGTGCVANGAMDVYNAFATEVNALGLKVVTTFEGASSSTDKASTVYISKSGCQGFCQMGPLVKIMPDDILYNRVTAADVKGIVEKTLKTGEIIDSLLYVDPVTGKHCQSQKDIPFYQRQSRFVLKQCGELNPEDIMEYSAIGGYAAAKKAYLQMTPEIICKDMIDSGLRGRGGGGFPTGKKWDVCRVQKNDKKYIICNGDEGDPGAFMDRSVMEGNPHAVIEGMMIAARAIGADEGYVYVRAEYPLAVKRVRKACEDARAAGILGDNVFGSGLKFNVSVMEGAGAFVCGEETALMASIEGDRGMPKPKPPFPAQSGLWGKPTVINNVETLATVPLIMNIGVAAFRAMGTATSPGTKTFALSGHVANTGLIEVPFGVTLKEIIFQVGGGVTDKKGRIDPDGFKAVQIGGPSGGCLTREHFDLMLDFDSLRSIGAMVGSGGLVCMNKTTCMVNIAKYFMQFTQKESCGKCVLCREGTKQMLYLLEDITEGRATMETLDLLKELALVVQKGSLCGLGKTAPNPVLSTLKYFYDEYLAHVVDKRCPTGECKKLAKPEIHADKCKGCTACVKKCPVSAIKGEVRKPHVLNADICIRCGVCAATCKFDAITGV
ncbi:MAG: NADH-ubiquinone oxidoreductase-F iron-sulfur binding region domain-containing protein [Candidatus Omnitrophota bacterium]